MGSSLLPAASGTVTLKDKDQANKTLIVKVHHLAQPENLGAKASGEGQGTSTPHAYVVWMQASENSAPENIGVLVPDKNLEAELTTTTSRLHFDIFVTAEPTPTQNAPTGPRLLQATVTQ